MFFIEAVATAGQAQQPKVDSRETMMPGVNELNIAMGDVYVKMEVVKVINPRTGALVDIMRLTANGISTDIIPASLQADFAAKKRRGGGRKKAVSVSVDRRSAAAQEASEEPETGRRRGNGVQRFVQAAAEPPAAGNGHGGGNGRSWAFGKQT